LPGGHLQCVLDGRLIVGQRWILVAGWAALAAGVGLLLQTVPGLVMLTVGSASGMGVRWLAWALAGAAPWLVGAWLVFRVPSLGVWPCWLPVRC